MVRPHLEYAIQVWNSYLKGDIDIIERVQRRAIKIPKSLWTKCYSERVKIIGLTTLEEKITRDYLIQMYKITKGLDKVMMIDKVEWKDEIEFKDIRKRHDLSFCR